MRSASTLLLLVAGLAWLAAPAAARVHHGGDPLVRGVHEDFKAQAMAPAPEARAKVAAMMAEAEEAAAATTPSSSLDAEGPAEPCPSEPYRPLVHFTPRALWMNDPNGLLFHQGEWHLFYQFNPEANVPGNISWGHAVSADLVRWEELSGEGSPAIPYDEDREMIFSGSAVFDQENTSGLGSTESPPLVAIYTSANGSKQAQSLAYSLDNGRTFTKYAGNPVLDEDMKEFRDPKVQWHAPTRRWLMAVALADDRKVRFYSSPDLKEWTHLSDFGPMGAVDGQYECPDLFPLPVDGDLTKIKWVLIVNVNPGGLHGGSSAQYFIGDFDGERFTSDDPNNSTVRWLDFGKDYYAAVSWNNAPDGQRYMIGWMSNWQYAQKTPTSPWRNAMSVPRVMSLRGRADGLVDLIQEPVAALASTLRHSSSEIPAALEADTRGVIVGRNCDGAFVMDATLSLQDGATAASILVRASQDGAEGTAIVWDAEQGKLSIDRRQSGNVDFSADFPGVHGAPVNTAELPGGELRLKVLVDEGSVEVFADGGRIAITDTIFPEKGSNTVFVKAHGPEGAVVQVKDVVFTSLRPYRNGCAAAEFTCEANTPIP